MIDKKFLLSEPASDLVSIIMPNFNRSDCISHAIQSVMSQTYKNWELIIIDNNSSDPSLEVIAEFHDERITVINIQNNGIVGRSRNAGLKIARGKYIALLDTDDMWVPAKLETCLNAFYPNIDVVYHDVFRSVKGVKTKNIIASRDLSGDALDDLKYRGNPIVNSSSIIKKSSLQQIGGFYEGETYNTWEDFITWISLAEKSKIFSRIPIPLGYYNVAQYSTSSRKIDHILAERFSKEYFSPSMVPLWVSNKLIYRYLTRGEYEACYALSRSALSNFPTFRQFSVSIIGFVVSRSLLAIKKFLKCINHK